MTWLANQLKRPDRRLQEHTQNLDQLENQMLLAIERQITLQKSELKQFRLEMLRHSPLNRIELELIQSEKKAISINRTIRDTLNRLKSELSTLSRSLSAVSPLNTLARGYSITYDKKGQVIRTIDNIGLGSKIVTRFESGTIASAVESVEPKKD